MALLSFLFQLLPSCIGLKSVSRDAVKLFCVKFASQKSLNSVIKVAINNEYSQQLGLNNNHFPVELAFNFYINNKITDCLGGTVNIESARKNFYTELFQHISLPRNYSFAPIIKEINQIIKRYTQQQFPITYADKSKGRLQTPAVMLKEIQLPTWKKTRIKSPTNPSYHYTSRSAINITSTSAFTTTMTSIFG
ncbi:hypothetical protein G9A89_018785 [Geosiphon pyriformis]|nr:hypothetical protein G9A89_018785 [Geosiphon pyriformis]